MKIALCDDDVQYISFFKQLIINKAEEFRIENIDISEFYSGEDLISDFSPMKYDVIFLDIEMKEKTGIETANYIRQLDEHVILIFLTCHSQYAPQRYKSRAFRYICKNDDSTLINKYLNEIIQEYLDNNKLLTITKNKKSIYIPIYSIKYASIDHRIITIYTLSGDYTYYGTMNELYKKLKPYGFEKIHKSILVNLDYVDKINEDNIVLKSGEKFLITRSMKKIAEQTYMNSILKRW